MTTLDDVWVGLAGVLAGTINTVVGSGALIAFPALLAVGYTPLVANVSSSLGLAPGSVSGAYGYRKELAEQTSRLRLLAPASALGSAIGAVLLLELPAHAFQAVAPVLIIFALTLVITQPWLNRWLKGRQWVHHHGDLLLWVGIFANGIYGGYFGAGQGIVMISLLVLLGDQRLQQMNAVKNFLVAIVNGLAGVIFIFAAHLAWSAVLLLAAGSVVGGQIGARIGRKLPSGVLRTIIVLVGVSAVVRLLL